ncbi:MAG: hypothetical protein ACRBK7_14405 [Acidimicrobiales bacterium]
MNKTRAPWGARLAFARTALDWDSDECLVWPYKTNEGYGRMTVNGQAVYAHRWVLEQTVGPPPDPSDDAAHAPKVCHNRACINPRHLRWASRKSNADDMDLDGTRPRGEKHGVSRLTEAQVIEALKGERSAASMKRLAARYDVSPITIADIWTGRTWGWLAEREGLEVNDSHARRRLHSKLDESDVREIRLALARGETHTSIAQRFGVSAGTVADIKHQKTWAWLDAPVVP